MDRDGSDCLKGLKSHFAHHLPWCPANGGMPLLYPTAPLESQHRLPFSIRVRFISTGTQFAGARPGERYPVLLSGYSQKKLQISRL